MTLKAVKAVGQHNFSSKDKLFLDANIWMFFFGPQNPRDPWVGVYSQAFSRILTAKSPIYIDVLIVSEFINTYARQKWQHVAPEVQEFKKFRRSSDFQPIAQDIASDVKRILQYGSQIESGFAMLEMDDLLDDFSTGAFDFNDQVITELCRREGLTLITHDGDFKNSGIPILTANRKLNA